MERARNLGLHRCHRSSALQRSFREMNVQKQHPECTETDGIVASETFVVHPGDLISSSGFAISLHTCIDAVVQKGDDRHHSILKGAMSRLAALQNFAPTATAAQTDVGLRFFCYRRYQQLRISGHVSPHASYLGDA